MKHSFAALAVLVASALVSAQMPASGGGPLTRHYREGETLTYRMTTTNEEWHYTADASGTTKKTASGSYIEEFRWTGMTSNGQPITLSPAMVQFREPLSLDPNWPPPMPDLSKVDPKMVGPITDLMTFYVDLWLINKIGILQHAGDHFYVPNPQASSWADGTRVLIGKSHIDFDLNLQSIDQVKQTAVVVIHHVPPSHPNLPLPVEWMQAQVADTANNWVQVTKTKDGKYEASVGKETFDVTIIVSTADGRILSASMENPVVTSGRLCDDSALTKCGAAHPHTIHRHIEIALEAGGPGAGEVRTTTEDGCPRCLAFGHLGEHRPRPEKVQKLHPTRITLPKVAQCSRITCVIFSVAQTGGCPHFIKHEPQPQSR